MYEYKRVLWVFGVQLIEKLLLDRCFFCILPMYWVVLCAFNDISITYQRKQLIEKLNSHSHLLADDGLVCINFRGI